MNCRFKRPFPGPFELGSRLRKFDCLSPVDLTWVIEQFTTRNVQFPKRVRPNPARTGCIRQLELVRQTDRHLLEISVALTDISQRPVHRFTDIVTLVGSFTLDQHQEPFEDVIRSLFMREPV